MTLWRLVFIFGGASLLDACAPHAYTLVPSDANSGQLHHDIYGPEKLSVTYARLIAGDFETTRSHRIHGRHRRHLGWIADARLSAEDGTHLGCHLEWPYAGKPSGTCMEPTGKSFAVRFE
ncbi:MAG: hypothetical protein GEV05_20525 [Betaproteobacteria bacterium]|nr:hypothetical protein [Betaproteobacteria bacterium]